MTFFKKISFLIFSLIFSFSLTSLPIQGIFDKALVKKNLENFTECGIDLESKRDIKLIVSLTSFPKRMSDGAVECALYSLLTQSLKPDKIILWLKSDECENYKIPEKITNLTKNGLEIKWIPENIRSYAKLLPALEQFPNDIIVTADDDIYYDSDWLEKLYKSYLKNPKFIHCHRAHKVILSENFLPINYLKWIRRLNYFGNEKPSYFYFFTGAGGVLYPPKVLYKDILNYKLAKNLCPTNDDIWFWAMAVLNKTKINIVEGNYPKVCEVGSGGVTLSSVNNGRGQNDIQIDKIFKYYPELIKILSEEK